MRIFYIARDSGLEKNGASQVMERNRNSLRQIIGIDNLVEYYLPKTSLRNVFCSILRLGSYGITRKEEKRILREIDLVKPYYVFIESSSLGSLYKALKKKPVKTICFAHNLDTALCKHEISSRSLFISWPKYLSTSFNEKRTAKYADCLVCLNERDSLAFQKTFGREADIILPITFPERPVNKIAPTDHLKSPYYLFVGSNFFPNVEGIAWFILHVAPHVDTNFRIVGSCCENEQLKSIPLPHNVKLIGYADDIDAEYRNAIGIIAPIFKGSGMKTKMIEALSYGKSIYGTDEAFAGIECDFAKIGGLCNTAEEFIASINQNHGTFINEYSLAIFKDQYSTESFTEKLKTFLMN